MEVFRIWVELDPLVIRLLKARAITQDINFRDYLGRVLTAAVENDPIAPELEAPTPLRRTTDAIQQPEPKTQRRRATAAAIADPTPTTAA